MDYWQGKVSVKGEVFTVTVFEKQPGTMTIRFRRAPDGKFQQLAGKLLCQRVIELSTCFKWRETVLDVSCSIPPGGIDQELVNRVCSLLSRMLE